MEYRSIRLFNFRNLADCEVALDAPVVFLIGENGQGKTNLLEAMYYLSYGSSFRTRTESSIPTYGASEFMVGGIVNDSDGDIARIEHRWADKNKSMRLNGKMVNDRKQIIRSVPCIVFAYEDIQLVTGLPVSQRWFFNQTASLLDFEFVETLRKYRAILRLRNAALRHDKTELLKTYDEQIAAPGLEIVERRRSIVRQINDLFGDLYRNISQEDRTLEVSYRPSWDSAQDAEAVVELLSTTRDKDVELGTSTTGPNRDHFSIVSKNEKFIPTASTGQRRLLSIILRIIQVLLFKREYGNSPVLLVDDILLEMDASRRRRLMDHLPACDQMVFTFLPEERYDHYQENALAYTIVDGSIIRR